MFKVMIRYAGGQVSGKKIFKTEVEALEYFDELRKKRTDHPANAILFNQSNQAVKTYRVDRDYDDEERLIKDDPIKKDTLRFEILNMPVSLLKKIEAAAEEEGLSPERWLIGAALEKLKSNKKGFW